MTNSTVDFWSCDGVSLQTQAWGIDKWGGDLEAPPKRRGGTLMIPTRPGQLWRPTIADSRTLTFAMWLVDCDEDGVYAATVAERQAQMLANWEMLRGLFWGSGQRELDLVKRWGSGYAEAEGQACFVNGLQPSSLGMQGARFTVDLMMSDPYFYGDLVTGRVTTSGVDLENIGDDRTVRLQLDFKSGTAYQLTNETTDETITVATNGAVSVDVWDMDAVKAGNHVAGVVSSDADGPWMSLAQGTNHLTLNSGVCDVTWRPVFW